MPDGTMNLTEYVLPLRPDQSLARVIELLRAYGINAAPTGRSVRLRDDGLEPIVLHVVRADPDYFECVENVREAYPVFRVQWAALPNGGVPDDALAQRVAAARAAGTLEEIVVEPEHASENAEPKAARPLGTYAAIAFKIFKSVKVVKAVLAAASLGAYTWLFTWQFALLLVAALVIHEMGHVWAMRRCGIPTKGFYLIPFVGGAAVPDRAFASHWEEAFVAAMGPTWGLLSIVLIAPVMFYTHDLPTAAGAVSMVALLNLFNLIPVLPLDGGRIFKSVSLSLGKWPGRITLGLVSLAGLGVLLSMGAFAFGLILLLGALEIAGALRDEDRSPALGWFGITVSLGWWLILCAIFGFLILIAGFIPEADVALKLLRGA